MMATKEPAPFRGEYSPHGASQLWQCVADALPDVLLLLDREGVILFVNRDVLGVEREKAVGSSVFIYLPPQLEGELRDSLGEIFDGAAPRSRELPVRDAFAGERWFAAHTGAVVCSGKTIAAAVVARDITERKKVDAALRESEARYRTLVEHAPEAIVVLDVDEQRFVDANENACRMFGLRRELMLESDPIKLSPALQPDGKPSAVSASEWIDVALEGGAPSFDWMHCTPAGEELNCQVRLVRLPSEGRRLIRGSVTDISAQRRIEEQVSQLQKMEAIGQLAGGIAHDFGNVLSIVSGSAELLARELPADEPLRIETEWILSAARSGATLTRQLLTFARRQVSAPVALELNELVDDVVLMVGRLLGGNINIVKDLVPGGAHVSADRGQLEQVIMNLVLNARDAMPDGGVVTIRTNHSTDYDIGGPPRLGIPRHTVSLRIEDNGVGMDEETRRKAFEPFFTTKPEGKGTGLGLSIVYGIVKQCGGRVEVSSKPGVGSAFEIVLPRLSRKVVTSGS